MCDITLGIKDAGLEDFAARLNALHMSQWAELGLYEDAEGWGAAFHQAVSNTPFVLEDESTLTSAA